MSGNLVLIEIADGIGTVTLNRPEKMNALTPDLCDALIASLRSLVGREDVRVIIITGAGRAFCAGAEIGRASCRERV